jgi:hypothetical protein
LDKHVIKKQILYLLMNFWGQECILPFIYLFIYLFLIVVGVQTSGELIFIVEIKKGEKIERG